MGASLLAKGIFHVQLEGVPGGFLLENLGYTFGFIIVIMARQQLFTENTVTAVLPVMQNPTLSNVGLLMRLWGVVLLATLLAPGLRRGHLNICLYLMKRPATPLSKLVWRS
ncbi:putative transport [Salmonella enterica subsp. enterica]|uniref:Putative transport n=1 Tax=Salmonella enterica I TaxID=59201 RepID=A0A379WPD3_SALET|nr:putative transport [Salmonella enterica subsp. enterica]